MIYTSAEDLRSAMQLNDEQVAKMDEVLQKYPMRITDYYFSLIDFSDKNDPILKMSIPSMGEMDLDGSFDTSGEHDNTALPGMQHKYAETVMILSTSKCAMYCRHCFRKRLVGLSDEEIASHFGEIVDYIKEHTEISNVLISGGDSFLNSNEVIDKYLDALTQIDHLDFIRFGTRTPVVFPERITGEGGIIDTLKKYSGKKQLFVVTQFNHPREITPESTAAVKALLGLGIVVRNQTVLLKGVNDDHRVLAELLRRLTSIGCLPYYIFQCRPVTGVKNQFQVPLHRGVRIIEAAKAMQNGQGKNVKYCMSHPVGKLEIVGHSREGELILKFHEARDKSNYGRLLFERVPADACWLD